MSEKPPADVLGALPHSRPHRRSEKRRSRPADTEAAAAAVERATTGGDSAASKPPAAKSAGAAAKKKPAATAKQPAAAKKPPPVTAKQPAAAAKQPSAAAEQPAAGAGRAAPPMRATPKRAATTGAGTAARRTRLDQPAQPVGAPEARRPGHPPPERRHDILGTAVQAAAEIAEIGLSASARALRRAVSRLPRP